MAMQAKLLRVIQDAIIDRIGGTASVAVDLRIVAATNIDVKKSIAEGKFREDLFYRLNVIPIHLPPLRERKEDIPLFLEYFINKFNKELNRQIKGFDQEAILTIKNYDWPGNVRELQNIVERMVTLSANPVFTKEEVERAVNLSGTIVEIPVNLGFSEAVANIEREYLKNVLNEAGGNRSKAARTLGIARTTLISKIEALGLD
jgi:two-component system response regulator AtoC